MTLDANGDLMLEEEPVAVPAAEPAAAAPVAAEPAAEVQEPALDDAPVVEEPAELESYALAMPSLPMSDDEIEDHSGDLEDFSAAASEAGLPFHVAQHLVESYASAAFALKSVTTRENTETHELEPAFDFADRDEARAAAVAAFGTDYAEIQSKAYKYASARPALAQYLGQSLKGNDPAVLLCLSLAQDDIFALSPAAAAVELGKLTSDHRGAFYHPGPGHVIAVARASILQGIVSEGETFDAEVSQMLDIERADAAAAREAAEQVALDRQRAKDAAAEMSKTAAEAKLRASRVAVLKANALTKAKADAADGAAERKARAWAMTQAPSAAATPAVDVSDARAEAAEILRSGATAGSSPAAQQALARLQKLLAIIS